jgi:hypothetical protein
MLPAVIVPAEFMDIPGGRGVVVAQVKGKLALLPERLKE